MNFNKNPNIYFIAEIGQNHQGSLTIAKKLVDELCKFNISAIKTAKRDIELLPKNIPYVNKNSFGTTYYEHRKALELSGHNFLELKEYVESKGLDFISSFTDINSLNFLLSIGIETLKIASSRVTDLELLKEVAIADLPVILSTGMSTLSEIDRAIDTIQNKPKRNELYILQCTSCYPCKESDLNLNILKLYRQRYDIDGVGFSGHHIGIAPDLAAYMMGAKIIERHVTLSRSMKGTDHAASLEMAGVEKILRYIDQMAAAKGSHEKRILDCEKDAIKRLRN